MMKRFHNTRSSVGSLRIQALGSNSELGDLKNRKMKGKYLYIN
jgi:hypothetical protein